MGKATKKPKEEAYQPNYGRKPDETVLTRPTTIETPLFPYTRCVFCHRLINGIVAVSQTIRSDITVGKPKWMIWFTTACIICYRQRVKAACWHWLHELEQAALQAGRDAHDCKVALAKAETAGPRGKMKAKRRRKLELLRDYHAGRIELLVGELAAQGVDLTANKIRRFVAYLEAEAKAKENTID